MKGSCIPDSLCTLQNFLRLMNAIMKTKAAAMKLSMLPQAGSGSGADNAMGPRNLIPPAILERGIMGFGIRGWVRMARIADELN